MEKDVDSSFFERRALPSPEAEFWPANLDELRELVERRRAERPLVILGGGEHFRASSLGERSFDVVRTGNCGGIRELDVESNTVRVAAGTTWGELREKLRERGRTLQRYRLQPEGATIGGLLARRRPLEKEISTGDLREGCVALTTVTPGGDEYSYLPAPRKASGPDNRFLYIGGEGFVGAILVATLVVWPQTPGRLLVVPADGVAEAVAVYRALFELDMRISWAHWSSRTGRLEVAIHAPESLLEVYEPRLRTTFGGEMDWRGPEAVRHRRDELESAHSGVRSTPAADRTWRVAWNLDVLPERIEAVDEKFESVEIFEWGRRRAVAHLVAGDEGGEPGGAGKFESALSAQRVADGGDVDWPEWSHQLKRELDPDGRFAVGP